MTPRPASTHNSNTSRPTAAATARLRVMVADANQARAHLLAQALTACDYDVVGVVDADQYLPTVVHDARPDVILIDTDSPSRDTLEQLTRIAQKQPRPVVMFATDDDEATIRAAIQAGVSAYIVDGVREARVRPIIDVAVAHFQRHQSMHEELTRTKQTLEERKMIDRAKGIVMQKRRCTEPEAFALLRKVAMDQKKRIGQVAADIIQIAGLMDGGSSTPETHKVETP